MTPNLRETGRRRARLVESCASLPEVDVSGDEHLAFKVRKKIFAYYLHDHHGDGRILRQRRRARRSVPGRCGYHSVRRAQRSVSSIV